MCVIKNTLQGQTNIRNVRVRKRDVLLVLYVVKFVIDASFLGQTSGGREICALSGDTCDRLKVTKIKDLGTREKERESFLSLLFTLNVRWKTVFACGTILPGL